MSLGDLVRDKLIDPVRRAQGSPESIARGGALGMWIALTPTVGAQMLVVAVLAVPLRANLPVAMAMVWITNPVTLIPFYFAFYWVGSVILGQPSQGYGLMTVRIREQLQLLGEQGLVEGLKALGYEVVWPMVVGSFVIATTVAIPTYHVLLWVFRRRRESRLLEQLEHRGQEVVEELGGGAPVESQDGKQA